MYTQQHELLTHRQSSKQSIDDNIRGLAGVLQEPLKHQTSKLVNAIVDWYVSMYAMIDHCIVLYCIVLYGMVWYCIHTFSCTKFPERTTAYSALIGLLNTTNYNEITSVCNAIQYNAIQYNIQLYLL